MQYNAKCSICGKAYRKCDSCADNKMKPWLSVTDNINHYKIFLTISNYNNKKIDKKQAKEMLEKCDISDYKSFVPEIASAIEDIMKEIKVVKKTKKEIKTVSDEDAVVD